MKELLTKITRIVVLLLGIVLALYMMWQLFTGTRMLDFDVESKGPLIVVVFGILLLLTIGASVSFFFNRHYTSTIFLGAILAVMSFILWIRHPEQADIYRLYFIYGLVVGLLSPFVLDHNEN
ncbi:MULTISPECIES: hypothetical protein [Lactobacillus]|uniref:Integral membrane protein n=1 Tax=Lactobacillus xujianguonis TaxID=2495899 RepID=A0A437ST21_9LACO|nr:MULTISPECIES: hypothetical protein [Lactobacillus]RVU70048.1 hypothetical protein EJK17_09700 [Lactobacillus xujianguonis]RVU72399.1 hypothetical protein EJK20_10065 [Lactobacillus xujianguonis]